MKRPNRADVVRTERVMLDGSGIQQSQIDRALDRVLDSDERLQTCKRQQTRGCPSSGCPLSPLPPRRASCEAKCKCRLSYVEFAGRIGILEPSLVSDRLYERSEARQAAKAARKEAATASRALRTLNSNRCAGMQHQWVPRSAASIFNLEDSDASECGDAAEPVCSSSATAGAQSGDALLLLGLFDGFS